MAATATLLLLTSPVSIVHPDASTPHLLHRLLPNHRGATMPPLSSMVNQARTRPPVTTTAVFSALP
ncbi:hypothetical protein E2562_001256 [Oryza meyeriana var. granulata]|uniref:Secreted protein n=1 Tax=Oryza meyeriana var. granulata TaxID=110450 RepID=A0A6G1DCV7_9ORYZ|nr:hypothetical protein E2562_001256 [Oryza meyeriana var. granulata]